MTKAQTKRLAKAAAESVAICAEINAALQAGKPLILATHTKATQLNAHCEVKPSGSGANVRAHGKHLYFIFSTQIAALHRQINPAKKAA